MIHANPLSVQLRMHKTTKECNLENHTILNSTWKLKVHFVFIKHEPVIPLYNTMIRSSPAYLRGKKKA
jgi:hypothetical protein